MLWRRTKLRDYVTSHFLSPESSIIKSIVGSLMKRNQKSGN
jgi:hypothetical protein